MPAKPIIGFHLDLKGMQYQHRYWVNMLDDLADQGVNTVLVEYEDVFPFAGLAIASDPKMTWTPGELRTFLARAKKLDIQVIPLQQCMGHLEYLLGWDRYRHLAENRAYPSTIKVTSPEAVGLIKNMLTQMIAAHPDSPIISLGMDEAHALKLAAKRIGKDVLDVYLDHLRALLPLVESAGKRAYIWTDMLEDHFRPGAFDDFRGGRVIFGTWDYAMQPGNYLPQARIRGGESSTVRVSKTWLSEPGNPDAPGIGKGTAFIEDWPADIKKMMKPYQRGRLFLRNFHVDLWTKLGMECLPVSAVSVSSHGSVILPYHAAERNIRGWSKAIKRVGPRNGAMGQIGTSWARGTSWCPPNVPKEVIWPLVGVLVESMGGKSKPFWTGVPAAVVKQLVGRLGRSHENWRLEGAVAQEMEELSPRVKTHRYEWDAIALLARVLELQRRVEYVIAEVEFFHANVRPVDSEWQRRLNDQKLALRDLAALRRRVEKHFGQRYHGQAFTEWVDHLFALWVQKVKGYQAETRRKLGLAKRFYARKG